MLQLRCVDRLTNASFRFYQGKWNTSTVVESDYTEHFSYDANGNILSADRHGVFNPVYGTSLIDSLTYHYGYQQFGGASRNDLLWVDDLAQWGASMGDIDDQPHPTPTLSQFPDNYEYDHAGNLVMDQSEGTRVKWNASGKVEEVRKDTLGLSRTIRYWYNAAGSRVKKQVIDNLHLADSLSEITYYVRDANEQVLAIYRQTAHDATGSIWCIAPPNNGGGGGDVEQDGVYNAPAPPACDNCTTWWNPWQEDYDGDGKGDICDDCPFSISPSFPCPGGGPPAPPVNPWMAMETRLSELMIYGSGAQGRIGTMRPDTLRNTSQVVSTVYTRLVDRKEYELKDHLGNVRVVISDLKLLTSGTTTNPVFGMKKLTVSHYYAFGMAQEGMSQQGGGYRYGFNGQEKEDEMMGSGNCYSAEFWQYDSRLGRRWNLDPMSSKYPSLSSYLVFDDNPILYVDINGDDWDITTTMDDDGNTYITLKLTAAVLNSSPDKTINMNDFKKTLERQLQRTFANAYDVDSYVFPSMQDGVIQPGYIKKAKMFVSVETDVRIIANEEERKSNEHLFEIRDAQEFPADRDGNVTIGDASDLGSTHVKLNQAYVRNMMSGIDVVALAHEAGHTLGLRHINPLLETTWEQWTGASNPQHFPDWKQASNPDNLMYDGYGMAATGGLGVTRKINAEQIGFILKAYREGELNQH